MMRELIFSTPGLPYSVNHFYTTIVNMYKSHFELPRMGSYTGVLFNKLKDMDLAKTTAEAKEPC